MIGIIGFVMTLFLTFCLMVQYPEHLGKIAIGGIILSFVVGVVGVVVESIDDRRM